MLALMFCLQAIHLWTRLHLFWYCTLFIFHFIWMWNDCRHAVVLAYLIWSDYFREVFYSYYLFQSLWTVWFKLLIYLWYILCWLISIWCKNRSELHLDNSLRSYLLYLNFNLTLVFTRLATHCALGVGRIELVIDGLY